MARDSIGSCRFVVCFVTLVFSLQISSDSSLEATEVLKNLEKPNVLFIAVDDLNDWIGPLGGNLQAKTPNFDRLFSQSTYFVNAHCNAPVCGASRNCIMSGLRPSTTGWYTGSGRIPGDGYREILKEVPPLPLHFRDNGYVTIAGGKIYHKGVADYASDALWSNTKPKYKWPKKFIARGHGYGGKHFYPFPKDGGQIYQHFGKGVNGQSLCWGSLENSDIPNGTMPDKELADWAVKKLKKQYKKPFFLAVGFRRPHVPYTAPKKYFDMYDLDSIKAEYIPSDEMHDIPIYGKAMALGTLPGGDHGAVEAIGPHYRQELIRGYLACVSFVDDQLGDVIDALDQSSHAENTIVVLWSDHGQQLGEKRRYRKQCLWEESTRVPLAFRMPDHNKLYQKSNKKCNRPVSLVDIYPTLLELCNLSKVDGLDGVSLVPLIDDHEIEWNRPAVTTWHYKNHSVRSEDWRYIVYRDGKEELYDHRVDPSEHKNLATDPKYSDIIAKHKQWLPKKNVLPAGKKSWTGDSFEATIKKWNKEGGPPVWLN